MRLPHRAAAAIGLLAAALTPAAAGQPAPARPNILFVLTDDQASWAVGVSGNPHAHTPNTDRLFREGAYLVNALTVTPVCSPSRASLMTSRYGSELGITDWINPGTEPDLGLDPEMVTWPELLRQAGYRTGLVGKWHLGTKPQFHPTRAGFGHFVGFLGGGTRVENPLLEKDGRNQKFRGRTTDILTEHALEFLRANKDGPFLLCVHYRAPHAPWLPVAEEDWKPFADLDPKLPHPDYPKLDAERAKRMTKEYLASVAGVDRNLGRLLKELDDLKLTENTVVIYTSDHGYNMGHNGIWHKGNGHWLLTEPPEGTENVPKGQRPNLYDNSLKVPAAVRWPGVIRPGRVVERTVTHLDWYPTLLAIAGVKLPENVTVRGRDFLPLLRGDEVEYWDDDFFGQYSTHHQSRTHMRCYRTPKWKLVRDFLNAGRDELYDLEKDPQERANLIDAPGEEVRRAKEELNRKLLKRMEKIDDPVLKR